MPTSLHRTSLEQRLSTPDLRVYNNPKKARCSTLRCYAGNTVEQYDQGDMQQITVVPITH